MPETRTKEEINVEYDKTLREAYKANEEVHRLECKLQDLANEYYNLLFEQRKEGINKLSGRLKKMYMNDETGEMFSDLLKGE